ncbi:uncharacterized protein LOC107824163 [Nicotiana tabacum]|uniref:uncharacterized protein LOC107824163 n=1 Tax=Nicotiana tabacum TaxID=4097 RepID=UPI003F4F2AED
MEYLQREMMQLAENGDFNFHPRCRKMGITHICFADDLLMFCIADIESIKLLQRDFQSFSTASRLQANTDKSSIYLAGVESYKKQDILNLLRFEEGTLPFRYLGVPLSSKILTV